MDFRIVCELLGDIITCRSIVVSSQENNTSSATQLWHAYLGHMSARSLLELYKHQLLKDIKDCKIDF